LFASKEEGKNMKKKMAMILSLVLFVFSLCFTVPAQAATSVIPSDAKYFSSNGHYYKVYHLTKTWQQARAYCASLGGHLATITSAQEQAFIKTLGCKKNYNYWLGATDAAKEGTWKWVTGEKWSYQAWGSNQPDNSQLKTGVTENYLQFCVNWGYLWNDSDNTQDSTASIGFICEWDSNKASISGATVTLSKSAFTYTGKKQVPTVKVQLGGKTLTKGTDYTVSYKGGTDLGTSYVIVTGKGSYTDKVMKSYTINLATPSLSSASISGSSVKVTWKKVTGAKGYYVYRKISGSTWKRVGTVKSGTTVSYIDKTVVKGKTYIYTVRAYNGSQVSGYDSKGKSVKYTGTGWQSAYVSFLNSYKSSLGTPKFALIYKSGSSIPYLFICESGSHVSEIDTYAYQNGKVTKIASEGAAYGTLYYNTGKKTIEIGWYNGFVYATSTNINYILTNPGKVTIS
jgi:hypothetical protein